MRFVTDENIGLEVVEFLRVAGHNDVARSPGRIPAEYVVGLVDAI